MSTKISNFLQKLGQSPFSLFVVLLGLGVIAYGLNIPNLGYYWDDWPWVWFSHVMGPEGMLQIDIEHRPISGVVLWIGALLSGENPIGWQIYNLVLRLLGGFALAWALRQIWPQNKTRVTWISLLFIIYPGFVQQFVAVNTSRHLFPLITFFLSLGYMVLAVRHKDRYWRWTTFSLVLSLITMFTTEYYYGLEFIRPVILWIVLRENDKIKWSDLVKAAKAWLPYLFPLVGVFIWRFVVSQSVNYQITIFEDVSSPINRNLGQWIWGYLNDLLSSGLGAWFISFEPLDPALFGARSRLYFWGIVSISTIGMLIYLVFSQSESQDSHWKRDALLLAAAALLTGPIPFWVTGLDPKLTFPADRLNLPMMLGASIIMVVLLETFFKRAGIKILIIALLIGMAAGFHNQNAINFRRDWQYQIAFFQQLTTRIPALEANTAVITNELPNNRSTDNSLTAPLNWIYAPDFAGGDLPLHMFYSELRFGREETEFDEKDLKLVYRFYPFEGSAEESLVIYHRPPACLRVMDDQLQHYFPLLPSFVKDLLPYSNPGQIIPSSDTPALPDFFNRIPQPENWCYFFEKADLARQRGDWQQIAELGDVAFALDDSPNHASERVPFIEGYAHTGQWSRAEELTYEALKINQFMGPMLCEAWERIEARTETSPERDGIITKINTQMDCDLY
jgi:hypothetical protein